MSRAKKERSTENSLVFMADRCAMPLYDLKQAISYKNRERVLVIYSKNDLNILRITG